MNTPPTRVRVFGTVHAGAVAPLPKLNASNAVPRKPGCP